MEKYSIEWKQTQQAEHGGWAQFHYGPKTWKWHYIQNDTEYSRGDYFTKKECEEGKGG